MSSVFEELALEFESALNTYRKVCKGVDELLDEEGEITDEQKSKMRFQIIRRPWRIVAKVIHKMQSQGYYWDPETEKLVKSRYFDVMEDVSPVVEDEYVEYDFEYDVEEDEPLEAEDDEDVVDDEEGEGVERELAVEAD